jgi:hypothetical protein
MNATMIGSSRRWIEAAWPLTTRPGGKIEVAPLAWVSLALRSLKSFRIFFMFGMLAGDACLGAGRGMVVASGLRRLLRGLLIGLRVRCRVRRSG